MKNNTFAASLAALTLPLSASIAVADIEYNLTLGFTASFTEAALRERNENGAFVNNGNTVYFNEWETYRAPVFTDNYEEATKIIVERISNREFLQEFIVERGIDDTIAGWALKLRIPSDDSGSEEVIYAVKGDQIEEIYSSLFSYGEAEQYRYNYKYTYNDNTEAESTRQSGSARMVQEVICELDFNGIELDFSAIVAKNESLRLFNIDGEQIYVWFPASIIFSPVVGSGEDTEIDDEEDPAVLQGRMSASGGKYLVPLF